nr:MAG TPA: hypothetical protein [Bacteriophage sp.]
MPLLSALMSYENLLSMFSPLYNALNKKSIFL